MPGVDNTPALAVLGILLLAATWLWVFHLPGYMLSRLVVPGAKGLERHALALVGAFAVFPLGVFLIAVAARLPVDSSLLAVCATTINLMGLVVLWPWPSLQLRRADTRAVALLLLTCSLAVPIALRSLDAGDVFATVHHCLYVIVLHTVANDPQLGFPLYDHLSGGSMYFLVPHPTGGFNGLAALFFEQRLGNAAIVAPPVTFFGSAGWWWCTVIATAVEALCLFLACRAVAVRPVPAVVAVAVMVWGVHALCGYYINENLIAAALAACLLWVSLRSEGGVGWAVLAGTVMGLLIGVRHTGSLLLPAVFVALWWRPGSWKQRLAEIGAAAGVGLLCTSPWLYVNLTMLGNPVGHPKLLPGFGNRVVDNQLLGWTFSFKPLNWPFSDRLVRTAWNAFPTFLWLPLMVAKSFGQLAVALGVLGAGLQRGRRRALVLLALFAIPHSTAIAWLEGVDRAQLSYAVTGLVPLAIPIAWGLDAIWGSAALRRRAGALAAITAAVVLLCYLPRFLSPLPIDMRLLDPQRWTEPPVLDRGAAAQRDRLTTPALLPRAPVLRTANLSSLGGALAEIPRSEDIAEHEGLAAYPSGQLALFSGYAASGGVSYQFAVLPAPLREAGTPVRTSLGLHTVALRLRAEAIHVSAHRADGRWQLDVQTRGDSSVEQDFTFFLDPWFPPLERATLTVDQETLPGLRTLRFSAGSSREGSGRLILTNYPPASLDLVVLEYTVETRGEAPHCGYWLFLRDIEVDDIETLARAGGHDQYWEGETEGQLVLPRNLLADTIVLFSDPYCSDHVPQPGDRYGVLEGPFEEGRRLELRLDRMW